MPVSIFFSNQICDIWNDLGLLNFVFEVSSSNNFRWLVDQVGRKVSESSGLLLLLLLLLQMSRFKWLHHKRCGRCGNTLQGLFLMWEPLFSPLQLSTARESALPDDAHRRRVILFMVDSHYEHGCVGWWCRNDDLFSSARLVRTCLVNTREATRRLNDVLSAIRTPRDLLRVTAAAKYTTQYW